MIEAFLEVRGVRYAALVDEAGALVAHVGEVAPDLDVAVSARALLGSLQNAVGEPEWNDLLLDLDSGPLLLTPLGRQLLMTAFDDVANLGRVRFAVRRALGI